MSNEHDDPSRAGERPSDERLAELVSCGYNPWSDARRAAHVTAALVELQTLRAERASFITSRDNATNEERKLRAECQESFAEAVWLRERERVAAEIIEWMVNWLGQLPYSEKYEAAGRWLTARSDGNG